MNYRNSFAITLALAFLAAVSANAQTQDIGIVPDGLRLHPTPLVAGWETRIYVTVRNNTSEDTRGFVSFLDNGAELGVAPISLKGGGVEEEAWYAWRPTYGSHAISAIVHLESGTDAKTRDNRVDRDVLVDRDSDGDGILDGADADDDNDGIVDTVEVSNGLDPLNPNDASADADGDGITNRDEIARGLNPRSADTDGDGSPDGVDAFPLDAKRQRVVAPPPPPAPIPTPISSIRVNASPPVSTSPPPAPLPPAVEQETVVRSNPEPLAQSLVQESVQRTKQPFWKRLWSGNASKVRSVRTLTTSWYESRGGDVRLGMADIERFLVVGIGIALAVAGLVFWMGRSKGVDEEDWDDEA